MYHLIFPHAVYDRECNIPTPCYVLWPRWLWDFFRNEYQCLTQFFLGCHRACFSGPRIVLWAVAWCTGSVSSHQWLLPNFVTHLIAHSTLGVGHFLSLSSPILVMALLHLCLILRASLLIKCSGFNRLFFSCLLETTVTGTGWFSGGTYYRDWSDHKSSCEGHGNSMVC